MKKVFIQLWMHWCQEYKARRSRAAVRVATDLKKVNSAMMMSRTSELFCSRIKVLTDICSPWRVDLPR